MVEFSSEKPCTSFMKSQPQLRNGKYIIMQYTNWISSTPSQHWLLSCLPQWLDHLIFKRGVAGSSNYKLHYWNHAGGLCGYFFGQIALKEHMALGLWNLAEVILFS